MTKCFALSIMLSLKNMDSMNLITLLHGTCNLIPSQTKKTTKQRYYGTYHGNLKSVLTENGANKPDISILDKKNKVWSLVEGTICTPGTIAERTKYKRDKFVDLRLGIKNFYPGYKVKLITILFYYLAYTTKT